jgi:hypothetical protein
MATQPQRYVRTVWTRCKRTVASAAFAAPGLAAFLNRNRGDHQCGRVLAPGSCTIETRAQVVELVEPELITDP